MWLKAPEQQDIVERLFPRSEMNSELQLWCRRGQELLTKNITLNIYSSITPPSADEDHMMWSQNSYEMDIVERPFPQPHQHHLTDAIKCCATLSLSFRQLVRSEYCTSHQMQIHSFVTLLSRCVCVCECAHANLIHASDVWNHAGPSVTDTVAAKRGICLNRLQQARGMIKRRTFTESRIDSSVFP